MLHALVRSANHVLKRFYKSIIRKYLYNKLFEKYSFEKNQHTLGTQQRRASIISNFFDVFFHVCIRQRSIHFAIGNANERIKRSKVPTHIVY